MQRLAFLGTQWVRAFMRHRVRGSPLTDGGRTVCVNHAATVSRLVIVAAAEAANQISYTEGKRGSRVRPVLDGCTQEVVGLAGTFADGFRGVCCRLLCLSVDILQRTLHLLGLALQLSF